MSAGGLDRALTALAEAADLARGRLDPADVAAAEAVVARAGQRLGLGVEATIVALAGPTGAGKSSLFNALAGEELVTAGHLRPTTSVTTAAVWGDVGDPLLDWLAVQRRHRRAGAPEGLVLLDLPDFDSVRSEHREEVERVVALADLMVWVVDPQKYADGVLHERYLRRFAHHGATMLVVLNQADRLDAPGTAACLADLGRLLAADGLPGLPVLALSARTGEGVEALRDVVGRRVAAREAAIARLGADVRDAAAALQAGVGDGTASGSIGRGSVRRSPPRWPVPPGSRWSPARWPARTGAAARSPRAGRSRAGCAASARIRCGGCGSARAASGRASSRAARSRRDPRSRRPRRCSARRSRPRRARSPTARRASCPRRGPGSCAAPRWLARRRSPPASTPPSRAPT